MFLVQLTSIMRRKQWQQQSLHIPVSVKHEDLDQFMKNLPFELTQAQKKVILEIIADLSRPNPMNRLVQGDVGSGKTVVAATIIYLIFQNNLKSLYMAPTEILAFQHYQNLTKLLAPYGIKVGIYTGSRKFTKNLESRIKSQGKKKTTEQLDSSLSTLDSEPDVIVGTHALLSKQFNVENVGLVVIDEQQRFGVEQRSILRNKGGKIDSEGRQILPHFLTMTATPIPRTVALTLYGDLDLSIIDQLPKGRKEIKTHFVPKKKRDDAYKFIESEVKQGFQVYIITPFIEPSETDESVKAATVEYERLKTEVFPNLRLGLLHGRMKSKDKDQALTDFKDHKVDILVSTSVVEVGVDVPNATIMVIEGAQRFGLAQLHQLRGRVGRGKAQSYTFLFTDDEAPPIVNRLKNLETIHDGLKLSELDLKIRGSGELFGVRQSGEWNLKIASLADLELIEETRNSVNKILEESPKLDKYPQLLGKLAVLSQAVMPD
jgi:ATP-dependent DNA helicase RecG